jgi:natural product biosynthesis luciferase-like monooxygenase protein
LWTPERHFHEVGSLYPNPSILNAALATITSQVKLRAGSVVLPLHDPLRVAEEWAVVDNLSNGRAGVAIASGWHPRDFVFRPGDYEQRRQVMQQGISDLQRLWAGEAVSRIDGGGTSTPVKVFPRPIQPTLPLWVTASRSPETFMLAGRLGANVLTHLLGQTVPELSKHIALYRQARAANGHDPSAGQVTVMVHTFMGEDREQTVARARDPFLQYMRAHLGLSADFFRSLGLPLPTSDKVEVDSMISFAFERYSRTAALIGTPESCLPVFKQIQDAGADEIACLIDWMDVEHALQGLPSLRRLRDTALMHASTESELRQALRNALPSYMVPESVVLLDKLPRSPNGKIDRRALPAPATSNGSASAGYVEPRSDFERQLAAMWAEVLRRERVGVHDNFFELGGHSLLAARLVSRMQKAFGVRIPLRDLFDSPTISTLARVVEEHQIATSLVAASSSPAKETVEF